MAHLMHHKVYSCLSVHCLLQNFAESRTALNGSVNTQWPYMGGGNISKETTKDIFLLFFFFTMVGVKYWLENSEETHLSSAVTSEQVQIRLSSIKRILSVLNLMIMPVSRCSSAAPLKVGIWPYTTLTFYSTISANDTYIDSCLKPAT